MLHEDSSEIHLVYVNFMSQHILHYTITITITLLGITAWQFQIFEKFKTPYSAPKKHFVNLMADGASCFDPKIST